MTVEIITDYKSILAECFASDQALLDQWHIVAGQGLDACVEKTFYDLQFCKVTVFKVTDKENLVGYFGQEKFEGLDCLTGFFLKPEYRSQWSRSQFWKLIKKQFNDKPFYCGLYSKNTPAIKFLESHQGALIAEGLTNEGHVSLFKVGV